MGTEPTATGWTTTGVSTSSAATTPSLTGDDVAVYVRRGSATMTQAMALESAIESTIDSSKALSIAVDTGLDSSLGVEIRTALTFASHRNRASALRRAAALVRSLPGRALGDPATNLAEKLTETDLLIHSGPTDLSDYAGVLARTGLLASDLGAAEFAATSTPPYSALYRQVGIVIYGLVALALVPVSAAPAGDREGLNDDLTAERRLRSAGIVADPRQEESRSFELVWSIIQRAIDTHAIAPHLEADLHLLNDMVAKGRQLVVANGDDLIEYASRELDRLLPEVLDATLPDTDQPARQALALSASRAPEIDQLAALDAAAESIEATLAPLAEQTPPRSYAPALNRCPSDHRRVVVGRYCPVALCSAAQKEPGSPCQPRSATGGRIASWRRIGHTR